MLTVLAGQFRNVSFVARERILPHASDPFPPLAKGGSGGVVPAKPEPGTRFWGGGARREGQGPPLRSRVLVMPCSPPLPPLRKGGTRNETGMNSRPVQDELLIAPVSAPPAPHPARSSANATGVHQFRPVSPVLLI